MSKPKLLTLESVEECLGDWLKKQPPAMAREADLLPLRRDTAALLVFVRDNKVVGTASTGNMPLAAVREVTARFVDPPALEADIGGKMFQVRSEENIWALYFLHVLADVGGLVTTGRARRWRLTERGNRFLDAPPLLQVPLLAGVWWYRTNWLIAYSYRGMGDALPWGFSRITLAALRSLPTGTYISAEKFADELIEKTGLTWGAQDSSFAAMALRGSVYRMVIFVLARFGALQCRYEKNRPGKGSVPLLSAFEVTPWGSSLLEALTAVGRLTGE